MRFDITEMVTLAPSAIAVISKLIPITSGRVTTEIYNGELFVSHHPTPHSVVDIVVPSHGWTWHVRTMSDADLLQSRHLARRLLDPSMAIGGQSLWAGYLSGLDAYSSIPLKQLDQHRAFAVDLATSSKFQRLDSYGFIAGRIGMSFSDVFLRPVAVSSG